MKKYLFLFVIATCFVIVQISCNKTNDETNKLSLVSPNGESIAKSFEVLNEWAKDVIVDKFGEEKKFKITDIKYFNVKYGHVAQIYYEIEDGVKNSFLLSNQGNYDSNGLLTRVAPCKEWTISCSGGNCCTATFNPGTGNSSCVCSDNNNSQCTMTVKCVEK